MGAATEPGLPPRERPARGVLSVTRTVPDQASLGVEPNAASAQARLVGARQACRDPMEPRVQVAVRAD
eukprot:80740-Pyramimonas_sp.AAC.1